MKRTFIIVVLALPFVVALAFFVASNRELPVADSPLPNPNGYDLFLKAGGMSHEGPGFFTTMSEAELADLVATNAEALALAHSALTNACRVPVQYSSGYFSTRTKEFISLRRLAQTWAAQGRLAELRNHPAEAAKDYLDVIHFGTEAGRGGFVVDAMIGIAIERLGQSQLTNLIGTLDATTCRMTATALETLDSHHQTWAEVMQRERVLGYRIMPDLKTFLTVWWFTHKDVSETRKMGEKIFHEKQTETRSLAVQFAARAYELEKGRPPTKVGELSPGYLKTVPIDPVTGKDLAYPPR